MTDKLIQPEIKIPKADEKEVVTIPEGTIGKINEKFEKIDQVLLGIFFVVVLAIVAIIISVIGLFLDQMRFNNVLYKEYSDKTKVLDINLGVTKELLNQNKQTQELIIKQQKQIEELFKKK